MNTPPGIPVSDQTMPMPPTPERYPVKALPAYDDLLQDTRILRRVNEISKFSFTVFYQNNGSLTHQNVAEAVLAATLGNLADILVNTGLHYLHSLEAISQQPSQPGGRLDGDKAVVTISQKSVFPFVIRVYDDRFVISRESSSFRDFYAWYRLFMPTATQLEATVRQTVARKYEQSLDVTQTQFEFGFIFSDFTKRDWPEKREPRNVDVLSPLIPMVPNQQGATELTRQDFPRLDLTVSRLERFAYADVEKWRNCWYMLEAPSNERSRFIVFTAQLRNVSAQKLGSSPEIDDTPMIPFDPDFSEDYALAICDFLKLRALDDFMDRLLSGWDFQTQRQL